MATSSDRPEALPPRDEGPSPRSHYLPRTRAGWAAVVAFLALFAFTQPPLVYLIANRITPWLVGVPFLYGYLLALYTALIVVLLWALRRGV